MKLQAFESVWDAIETDPAVAASLKARSEIMIAIKQTVTGWGLTQALAAKRLSLTQPRLNDLLKGRINKFSLEMLMDIAHKAGLQVKIAVKKMAA